MPFDAQAGLGFAQHAIALGDFLKRCYQLDEQHDVLGLPILATGSQEVVGSIPISSTNLQEIKGHRVWIKGNFLCRL